MKALSLRTTPAFGLLALAVWGRVSQAPLRADDFPPAVEARGSEVDEHGGKSRISFDPAGRWVLTLPAGWQRKATLVRASADTVQFDGGPGLLFNGVYEFHSGPDQLAMIEADDPTQRAYVWQVLNANTLQLVEQDTPSGGNYVGATLTRHVDWDQLPECTAVACVGSLSHKTFARATTMPRVSGARP